MVREDVADTVGLSVDDSDVDLEREILGVSAGVIVAE